MVFHVTRGPSKADCHIFPGLLFYSDLHFPLSCRALVRCTILKLDDLNYVPSVAANQGMKQVPFIGVPSGFMPTPPCSEFYGSYLC